MTAVLLLVCAALAGAPGAGTPPSGAPTAQPGPAATQGVPGPPSVPAPPQEAAAPAAGDQRVTVYLRGVPSGMRVQLQRGEEPPAAMADPGTGVLTAELYGPPARFLQLRLVFTARDGRTYAAYDGLVVLADYAHETIAFQFQDGQALRLPVAPSARTEVALDQRVTWWVTFGWGALSLVWLSVLGVLWTLRSR